MRPSDCSGFLSSAMRFSSLYRAVIPEILPKLASRSANEAIGATFVVVAVVAVVAVVFAGPSARTTLAATPNAIAITRSRSSIPLPNPFAQRIRRPQQQLAIAIQHRQHRVAIRRAAVLG